MTPPPALKLRWYHILLSLAQGPRHGLAVAREVTRSSGGRIRLWPAMLYGSLQELVSAGLIVEIDALSLRPDANARRRYYGITRAGRAAFAAETARLAGLVRLARQTAKRQHA